MKNNHIKTIKVSIIGQPNVGKSTFINSLVGKKVAITSKKAQTTIKKEIGIVKVDGYQIILLDTPGVLSEKYNVTRQKFSISMNAVSESNFVLVIFCNRTVNDINLERLLKKIASMQKEYILILNKIDLLSKTDFINSINKLKQHVDSTKILAISALKNYGLEEITKYIIKNQNFYNKKILNKNHKDNDKQFIQEIVREKILRNIHDEVPYNTRIEIDKIFLKKDSSYCVYITIYLKKISYKPIILGTKGRNIKKISIEARKELEHIFKKKYHLFIYLKTIRKNKKTSNRRIDIE